MAKAKLTVGYMHLTPTELIEVGTLCVARMKSENLTKNPLLDRKLLKADVSVLASAEMAWLAVDSTKNLDDLNRKKIRVVENLRMMAQFYNMTYGSNLEKLHATGLLLTVGTGPAPVPLVKVSRFKVERASSAGSVICSWKRLRGIGAYLIVFNEDDHAPMTTWQSRPSIGLSALEISGFTPGARMYFRIVPLTREVCESGHYLYSDQVAYVIQ